MEKYLAHRIEGGHLDYTKVINKYPKYKPGIDAVLNAEGYSYIILGVPKGTILINNEPITINNKPITID